MGKFSIDLEDKPFLSRLMKEDKQAFKDVVGTFVSLMEVAAEKKWHKLPDNIHSSIHFNDLVTGVLSAVMTTREIDPKAYSALEEDLHPLALLSDKRKDLITGDIEYFNWRNHFTLDTKDVSKETIEAIIRKMLYLVRWFDIDTISKSLMANQFPIMDTNSKEIAKLPFQPALNYQKNELGELHVGKFLHDVGAFNCGEIDLNQVTCPACNVGELLITNEGKNQVCPRCNAGFTIKEELSF